MAAHAYGSTAALLLLVGGLAMLAWTMLLVFLQCLLPARTNRATPDAQARSLRPIQAAGALPVTVPARRRGAAREPFVAALDRALATHIGGGNGEARLLRSVGRASTVRVYGCNDCLRSGPDATPEPGATCEREAGALQAAFAACFATAAVSEPACRRRGDAYCDFEVRH